MDELPIVVTHQPLVLYRGGGSPLPPFGKVAAVANVEVGLGTYILDKQKTMLFELDVKILHVAQEEILNYSLSIQEGAGLRELAGAGVPHNVVGRHVEVAAGSTWSQGAAGDTNRSTVGVGAADAEATDSMHGGILVFFVGVFFDAKLARLGVTMDMR